MIPFRRVVEGPYLVPTTSGKAAFHVSPTTLASTVVTGPRSKPYCVRFDLCIGRCPGSESHLSPLLGVKTGLRAQAAGSGASVGEVAAERGGQK